MCVHMCECMGMYVKVLVEAGRRKTLAPLEVVGALWFRCWDLNLGLCKKKLAASVPNY